MSHLWVLGLLLIMPLFDGVGCTICIEGEYALTILSFSCYVSGTTGVYLKIAQHEILYDLNDKKMPVCSLFLKQQITLLSPSQYPSALALPDRSTDPLSFNVAISSAGLGVRAVCALPRMASAGGYPGSAGNAPNIVACIVAIILGIALAVMASKRAAAVARWEIRAFFIVFALQYFFQLLSTGRCLVSYLYTLHPSCMRRESWLKTDELRMLPLGSFIQQNTASIVWVTAIQLGLVLVLWVSMDTFAGLLKPPE